MSIITSIITHRGLDFSKTKYYPESTLESFKEQLKKGYGLEFDIRITKDDKFII